MDLEEAFSDINIQHISRAFNVMVDVLSKRGLSLDPRVWRMKKWLMAKWSLHIGLLIFSFCILIFCL